MTYWTINVVFLLPAAVAAVAAFIRISQRSPLSGKLWSFHLRAVGQSAALLLVLTAVFDNAMIAAGLFGYNPEKISGAMIGLAPLEDFAYPVGALLLLPAMWIGLAKKPGRTTTLQEGPHE
ncbi:lycopene cyclase domain-containing protein [Paenarthrobacter sp. PH39-S1]|uniref:lycopene cyclase domain-containing protein n=1 Tax=Paenarthrobacter sp. PH39-S1 TaxID=3046204 RepID=UPI0024BA60B6|nr:lycopene cyclase domain-containing protein [Paenarthrobacter sp. PH39-S1]MDJ0355907.1 lycopene cyclase domain-containing protein [Paenarthrobacter sp. PH39-S1]